MAGIKELWKKNPGLVVSGGAHVLGFLALIVNFTFPPKFEEQVESVPVEMITDSQFNQITNGEKTAKPLPKPQRRVDKVAELEDHKPAPPLAEAKKDTPPPPSPDKANDDPGEDDKPTEKAAPPPTPPERPAEAKPVPQPPERPVEKAETPQPPPKPDDIKPPLPDAEALDQKPPPKPKVEKHEPKKVAKVVPPTPPKRPDAPRKPEPKPKETLDQVAKLLDTMKPPKPVTKQRSGNEAKDAKPSNFSLDKITALLDHEPPQRKASTGKQLTQLASLGSPTAHAEKLSPTMTAQIDGWLIDHYRGCWSYFGLGATQDYVPKVRVRLAPDGTLIGRPALLNPPGDPNLQSLADSALRAVNRCNPMEIPDWFKAHYEAWRDRTVRFDPKEMS